MTQIIYYDIMGATTEAKLQSLLSIPRAFHFIQFHVMYLRDGLLRLLFKPMLLLLLPRRLAWFFMASSHMPMLPEEPPLPPLPSMPPGPPHMPTPSTHWPPMEDMPECWKTERNQADHYDESNISIHVCL